MTACSAEDLSLCLTALSFSSAFAFVVTTLHSDSCNGKGETTSSTWSRHLVYCWWLSERCAAHNFGICEELLWICFFLCYFHGFNMKTALQHVLQTTVVVQHCTNGRFFLWGQTLYLAESTNNGCHYWDLQYAPWLTRRPNHQRVWGLRNQLVEEGEEMCLVMAWEFIVMGQQKQIHTHTHTHSPAGKSPQDVNWMLAAVG